MAGPLTFAVFTAGIITTGVLALAGLAVYALGETLSPGMVGLAHLPLRLKAFYATIGMAWRGAWYRTAWSPMPVMVTMMLVTRRQPTIEDFTLPLPLQIMGRLATATMAGTIVAMAWAWVG